MNEELKVTFTLEEEQPIDCVFRIDATTFDYEQLDKKPQINGETLIGNKTSEELHLASTQDIVDVNDRITSVSEYFEEDIERVEQNIQNEATTRAENDTLLQNNINTLDEKVDGINVNLTQQIEETQQDVNNKYNELVNDIDTEIQARENADTTINQRITDVADELNQTIEENVVALQQEDTALQNQINAHSTTLTAYDTRITNNANAITQEVTNRQNADDGLSNRIDVLEARGRFLALWNAVTGLPESTPQITPYTYKTGDYYIVDAVGEINYKPTGTEFVEGQASTELETEELTTDDVYYYDGAVWRLQINHGKTVSFANLAGQPSDNTNLKNALDGKQDVIDDLDSYVKNTDFATTSTAGVIRANTQYGIIVNQNNGVITSVERNQSQYDSAPRGMVMSKGTLENIKEYLVTSVGDTKYQLIGDYATNTALSDGLATKQNKLNQGANIVLTPQEDGTVTISASGGLAEVSWGGITGEISNQTDLKTALDNKTQVIIRSW